MKQKAGWLLLAAPLAAAGCAFPTAAAPTVTVTATHTTEAPAPTVTSSSPPPSSYGTRELLAAAFEQLPSSSQQQLCDIYRGSPSNAWSLWEATATGASATVTRSDFMAVFGAKCA